MDKAFPELGSFRDPSGFLFRYQGTLYRQINQCYQSNYELLLTSGLYDALIRHGLLVPHQEISNVHAPERDLVYKIIEPEEVQFVSYPYEWSFVQLRGAALTTLRIAKLALEYGMQLKDASAYNIQFHKGRWRLIDTLSFEKYQEGQPWIAYRQFCQHFLAPLALMAYQDRRFYLLSRLFIDGIPLDMASKLLPLRTKLRLNLLMHIHLHARSQTRYADQGLKKDLPCRNMNRKAMEGLLDSLRQSVKSLSMELGGTEWANYYDSTNYSREAFEEKKAIVETFLDLAQPKTVWDLGANTGEFSRLASKRGIFTVAFDIDPDAVTHNYLQMRKERDTNLLPLMMDLTNPSPSLGWAHEERNSLISRGPVDCVLALALVHHLAIANNVPLYKLAAFFKEICTYLIIEFIPKNDSQVVRLLNSREDIFDDYHVEGFERAFATYFEVIKKKPISDSDRLIYYMKVK